MGLTVATDGHTLTLTLTVEDVVVVTMVAACMIIQANDCGGNTNVGGIRGNVG